MGGRVLDYIAQGAYADRPLAASMPALIQSGGASIYYANDVPLILSLFNDVTVDWDELNITALAAFAFQFLTDVDWTTPPTDGQVFAWDAGSNKLIPITPPTQYTDELAQDAIDTAIAAGTHTGIIITYDDVLNKFSFAVTITQYTDAMAIAAVGAIPTQYTDELAQDALNTAYAAGSHTGITITYVDGSNKFDFAIIQASGSEVWVGTAQNRVVTPKSIWDAQVPVSVAYAATVTLNLNTGLNFDIGSLTGAITLANFTNAKPGQSGMIHFAQDSTGGRVITYGSNFVCAGGLATNGLLSTGASKIDELSYYVRTDGKIVVSILKDVKA